MVDGEGRPKTMGSFSQFFAKPEPEVEAYAGKNRQTLLAISATGLREDAEGAMAAALPSSASPPTAPGLRGEIGMHSVSAFFS
jgi:hypothetical protein